MADYHSTIDSIVNVVKKLRLAIKKGTSAQIRSAEHKSMMKAIALAWFNNQRGILLGAVDEAILKSSDDHFKNLIILSEKACTRSKVDKLLKDIKKTLTALRAENIKTLSTSPTVTTDIVPKFALIVADKVMVDILEKRWKECVLCVQVGAPLSAIVMMGGLLESLLMTRFLQHSDKKAIFATTTCPKDKTGTPVQFKEWALKNYIDVAHELTWISQTEKDLGEVLRDYRNYIHPFKERSHGVKILPKDAATLWEVTKSISKEIIV